jgi:hypothetical protein
MNGAIVIAKVTCESFGYKKGDTLKIRRRGTDPSIFFADNLTRPNYGGQNVAVIADKEFKLISGPGVKAIREKTLFGITYYREIIKEAE